MRMWEEADKSEISEAAVREGRLDSQAQAEAAAWQNSFFIKEASTLLLKAFQLIGPGPPRKKNLTY